MSSVVDRRDRTWTLASGCAVQNAVTGSASVVEAVGSAPSRSVPVMPDWTAATSALNASCSARILLAQTTRRSPSGVRP